MLSETDACALFELHGLHCATPSGSTSTIRVAATGPTLCENASTSLCASSSKGLNLWVSGVARNVLRELDMDIMAMASPDDECALLTALAAAVASSRLPLTRLYVTCQQAMRPDAAVVLRPLDNAGLADPLRVRCAAVSGLEMVGLDVPDIACNVVAFAARTAPVRRLRTQAETELGVKPSRVVSEGLGMF